MKPFSLLALLLVTLPASANPRDCGALQHTRALLERAGLQTAGVERLLQQRRCGPAPAAARVELFGFSDQCGGAPVAVVGPRSRCDQIRSSSSVWSVRVAGRCYDTQDLAFEDACERFQVFRRVHLFGSDTCSSKLLTTLDARTRCDALPDAGISVWGVGVEGACVDVRDTSPRDACERYRYGP